MLSPTTPVPKVHKSTLRKSARLSISKISLSCLATQLDTNPLSHKSAMGERDSPSIKSQLLSTCPPGDCVAHMRVYVYYHICKCSDSEPLLPCSQCPGRSIPCDPPRWGMRMLILKCRSRLWNPLSPNRGWCSGPYASSNLCESAVEVLTSSTTTFIDGANGQTLAE